MERRAYTGKSLLTMERAILKFSIPVKAAAHKYSLIPERTQ
jgi:hypothetical protein